MGKNKWSRHVDHEDEDIHPGCMMGFIHALGYNSWHSRVKRKSLPRINDGSSHIRSKSRFYNLTCYNRLQLHVIASNLM